MPRKRARIFETRFFAFAIGLVIISLILLIDSQLHLFTTIELKVLDTHFFLKEIMPTTIFQEGTVTKENDPRRSEDILIVGVDLNTLSKYGRWPFARWRHSELLTAFSRIKNQEARESAVFLDIFFADPSVATDDALLIRGIKESGKVFLETVLDSLPAAPGLEEDNIQRQRVLMENGGTVTNIKGDWQSLPAQLSADAPLVPFGKAAFAYGHANFINDSDKVFRKQPMVMKYSELIETIKLDDLKPGFTVNEKGFERLAWMDKNGAFHTIRMPLDAESIKNLRAEMEKNAPLKVEDSNGDGTPETEYYIVRHYADYFIPSITLSLALEYFGKTVKDAELIFGDSITIRNPSKFNPETGVREPYTVTVVPDQFDQDGNLVKEGVKRLLPEIVIPINQYGQMLVNFMGKPSEAAFDGVQTFPIRSYSGYASKSPSPDASTWPRTLNLANKIIMVGAFTPGMAQDEKQTPHGLMYGIEIHANALNTILMDNFLHYAPVWVNTLILFALVLLVCFYGSRLSTFSSLFITLFVIIAFFFMNTFIFEGKNLLIDFTKPAIGMIFAFIGIIVYRAFTEERDKKQMRETFGKYVSPHVVDQLVENPPELGGVDKELTVFFSDIRGFTTLSESMSPQELVNHLNVYLTSMTDTLLDFNGTLDKYIGDAVMAFWGAPLPLADHAVLACKCALVQMKKLAQLNAVWPEAIRINIGIGINSGIMTVGNMGSPLRMNYTLMGDNVNLCSRLEATNKEYGSQIIISEYTYGLVKDKFVVRELDNIRVKGKNKPVVIYELMDCLEDMSPPKALTK